MGIFSRMRDIVHSNINTMLEKAEDPEKLIKLMIQEMEDTLIEIKASCAGSIAGEKKIERDIIARNDQAKKWESNAELAIKKGRDDLAREALLEKRKYQNELDILAREAGNAKGIVVQYKNDIDVLEAKLKNAREQHRGLVERHIYASNKTRANTQIRKAETSDAFARFEDFQNRIVRIEEGAKLVNIKPRENLEEEFKAMEKDEKLESELSNLKKSILKP